MGSEKASGRTGRGRKARAAKAAKVPKAAKPGAGKAGRLGLGKAQKRILRGIESFGGEAVIEVAKVVGRSK